MEVLVGPTYSMEVSPSTAFVRDRSGVPAAQDKVVSSSSSCLFLKDESDGGEDRQTRGKLGSGYGSDDSSDSSSIGDPGDSEEEEEEEEDEKEDLFSSKGEELEQFKFCLDSLEDSLPIKRGLSNHYIGKSKSFGNLSEASTCTAKDLEKPDNPFNKRRRVLVANKWSRRSSFYSWQNPKSMPLLPALDEEEDNVEKQRGSEEEEEEEKEKVKTPSTRLNGSRLKFAFKSQSCFSLADLQEEEEDHQS